MSPPPAWWLAASLLLPAPLALASASSLVVQHDLAVRIEPGEHRLAVRDRLRIPAALVTRELALVLASGIEVKSTTPGLTLALVRRGVDPAGEGLQPQDGDPEASLRVDAYRVDGATAGADLALELAYEGVVNHPIRALAQQYARGFSQTPGLIEERGVYLGGTSFWTAQVRDTLVTYRLAVDLPPGWRSVSQGARLSTGEAADAGGALRAVEVWSTGTPTEDVHLIAARFTEYARDAGSAKAVAFLRTPDEALAGRYLEATERYLEMYQGLLGPYPYPKFALVENFWETGYGMPSFTLLGEQILRFPFLLGSSYPHELLHNWWGNGVFVDLAGGNWCEGLTAYLADHLFAEQRGAGSEHRRDLLQRVTDYVTPRADFPVTAFKGRTDAVTEAIGYGKAAIIWHMLRRRLGDELFVRGLRGFYRDHQFRRASFDDLRTSFEAASGQDLRPFFLQWLTRTGIPELRLDQVAREGGQLRVTISQVQEGPPFALDVPVALHTAEGVELRTLSFAGDRPTASATFALDSRAGRVQRVVIDPQFDVYRRLGPLETPPTLSKAFGASRVLIVTPTAGADARYDGLLAAWRKEGVEVVEDRAIERLPADRPVWILGAANRFVGAVGEALPAGEGSLDGQGLRLGGANHPAASRSLAVVARSPGDPTTVRVFLSAPTAAAADGLARKLPHYGKYSWLVFQGDGPEIEAKGEWPARQSPLSRDLEPQPALHPLPARKALAEVPPAGGHLQAPAPPAIVQTGAPVLRARAQEVPAERIGTPAFQELLARMVEAMRKAPGVGLAAPQLGVPWRVIVLEDREELIGRLTPAERAERGRVAFPVRVFVNPKLRLVDGEKASFFEGCLSVAGFAGLVERAAEVEVSGLDEHGAPQTWRVRGWPARILQHEVDHLDGTLYIDRMVTRSFATLEQVKALYGGKPITEVKRLLGLENRTAGKRPAARPAGR
jgi:peptide deformylase